MSTLAHSFLGLPGALGLIAEVALFVLLFAHIFALVHLSESDRSRDEKMRYAAWIALPVAGPLLYARNVRQAGRRQRTR